MDRINMSQPSHRITFDTLPKEIWFEVITLSITEYGFDFIHLSVERLLLLTLVSTKWMNEIYNTPLLWTDILLDRSVEDLDMKVACCIHFSRAACLSIYVNLCDQLGEYFGSIINANSSRIHLIHLGLRYGNDGARYENKLFDQTEFFPSLVTIIGYGIWGRTDGQRSSFNLRTVIQKAPLLKVVQGYEIPLDILRETRQKWSILDLKVPPETALPFLVQQPSLRDVRFIKDRPLDNAPLNSYKESKVNFASLSLTSLYLEDFNRLSFTSIPSTLSCFDLYGVFSTICTAVPFLSHMPRLQTLRVEIAVGSPSNNALLFEPCSASVVIIVASELYERERDSYDALWRIFPAVIPLVRRLTFAFHSYPRGFNIPTEYKLDRLEVLDFSCLDYTLQTKDDFSLEEPLYVPPSVIKVEVSGTLNFRHRLGSTSVEELEMSGTLVYYTLDDIPRFSQWTVLRSLSLSTSFSGSFRDISLPNLVTLTLSGPYSNHSKPVTDFCKQLAVLSENYPSFRHLKAEACPEWDILFIMLERRNLIRRKEVARITSIELPVICPPGIRRLLTELIRGETVTRPSNFALSFAGNLDAFWDEST